MFGGGCGIVFGVVVDVVVVVVGDGGGGVGGVDGSVLVFVVTLHTILLSLKTLT